MPRLLSVNVGLPRDIAWRGETVRTAIWKEPVQGRRMVRRLNIDGDKQADLAGHGGEYRAVFVYQIESYHYWERQLGRNDFVFGQFGENFTVDGLSDEEVYIGDRYRIGGALFEVTQPRVTCYRVGIRMNEPQMAALLVSHKKPGFYFRVLQEGEVEAGDEIIKVADGQERMTVAEIDGMLYLGWSFPRATGACATHPRLESRVEDVLPGAARANADREYGWREPWARPGERSAPGMARVPSPAGVPHGAGEQERALTGPGAGRPATPRGCPAWPVRGATPATHARWATALTQLLALRHASADHYRVSVKQEVNGAASTYVHTQVHVDDVLEVSAPRGTFTLRQGDSPVVLISAGVGATPVLAMLHALAAEASQREVWWLFGARNRDEHPFAEEARSCLRSLLHSHSYILYSRPGPQDQPGLDFDAPGHLTVTVLKEIGVPHEADFYLCGPSAFLQDLTTGLAAWGVATDHVHAEIFGPGVSSTPGVLGASSRPPHLPDKSVGTGPLVSFARSGLVVPWDPAFQSLLELAEACDVPVRWSCRTGVCHTCESGLIAGLVSYQPEPLERPADGNVLLCCSQPQDEVMLDL